MFKCLQQYAKSLNYYLTQTQTNNHSKFLFLPFFVVNNKDGSYKYIKIYRHLILIWIEQTHYICSFFSIFNIYISSFYKGYPSPLNSTV